VKNEEQAASRIRRQKEVMRKKRGDLKLFLSGLPYGGREVSVKLKRNFLKEGGKR